MTTPSKAAARAAQQIDDSYCDNSLTIRELGEVAAIIHREFASEEAVGWRAIADDLAARLRAKHAEMWAGRIACVHIEDSRALAAYDLAASGKRNA